MKLALASIAAGLVAGYLAGGRLENVLSVRLRLYGVALFGLFLQLAPLPGSLRALAFPMLLLSHAVLIAFALANVRSPGMVVLLAGVAMNLLVIGANRGMPVTRQALVAAHDRAGLQALMIRTERYHLAGPGDRWLILSDDIGSTRPFQLVISPGDVGIYLGSVIFVASGMRRKRRPPVEAVRQVAEIAR